MKNKTAAHGTHNLRLLVLFCVFVVSVLVLSLVFKLIGMVRESNYDSSLIYTISFVHENDLDLIAIHPQQKRISHVEVRGSGSVKEKQQALGTFSDTTMTLSEPFSGVENVSGYITKALLNGKSVKSDLNSYTLVRLLLVTQGVPGRSIESEEVRIPVEETEVASLLSTMFSDQTLLEESKSVSVINATGVPGLGKQFERGIEQLGGNVISITNAEKIEEKTSISYFGEMSKTAKKLGLSLHTIPTQRQDKGLSDIIITIGSDQVN